MFRRDRKATSVHVGGSSGATELRNSFRSASVSRKDSSSNQNHQDSNSDHQGMNCHDRSNSFHDFSGHLSRNEAETISDLKETITNLKLSLQSHAESKAETLEHFHTLQKAHDALFEEHQSLQEQMDDAVELLKYLKEEKVGNEDSIDELKCKLLEMEEELQTVKRKNQGSVVSATIEHLTKDKMELTLLLKQEREERQQMEKELQELQELSSKSVSGSGGEKYSLDNDPTLQLMGGRATPATTKSTNNTNEEEEAAAAAAEALLLLQDNYTKLQQQYQQQLDKTNQQETTLRSQKEQLQKQQTQIQQQELKITKCLQQQRQYEEDDRKVQAAMEKLLEDKDSLALQVDTLSNENEKFLEELEHMHKEAKEQRNNNNNNAKQKESEERHKQQLEERELLHQQQQLEVDRLNNELSTSLLRIAQLQRERSSMVAATNAASAANTSSMVVVPSPPPQSVKNNANKDKLKVMQQENEAMELKIQVLEEQLRKYQENDARNTNNNNDNDGDDDSLSTCQQQQQQQQQPSQSSTENAENNEKETSLLQNNENLQCQIQILQYQLEEQQNSYHTKEITNAQLEKDMQERLAKRLATQMSGIEERLRVEIEERVRNEVEEEYQQQQQQQKNESIGKQQTKNLTKSRSMYVPSSAKTEQSSAAASGDNNETIAIMEQQLRKQLEQVKEERERWQSEQELFQQKVILSQSQLQKVRDGYLKKAEKDSKRVRDLQESNLEKDMIIDRLSGEMKALKKGGKISSSSLTTAPASDQQELIDSLYLELDELREQHQLHLQTKALLDQQQQEELERQLILARRDAERAKKDADKEREELKEKCMDEIQQLQHEIDDFNKLQDEYEEHYQQWEEKKLSLLKQMNDNEEKYQIAMDELDELRAEKKECIEKMRTLEIDSSTQLARLEEAHKEALECVRSDLERSMEQQRVDDIEYITSELNEKHLLSMENLRESLEAENSKQVEQLQNLEEAHADKLSCLRSEMEESASRALDEKMQELTSSHNEELDNLRSELQSSASAKLESAKAQMEQQRLDDIEHITSELNEKHSQAMDSLRERLEAENSKDAEQLQKLEEAHADEISRLRSEMEESASRALEEKMQELASSHNEELDNLRSELQSSAAAERELTQVLAEAEEQRLVEVERVRNEMTEKYLAEMQNLRESVMAEAKASHLEKLREETERIRSSLEESWSNSLKAELKTSADEYAEATEKLKAEHESRLEKVRSDMVNSSQSEQLLQLEASHKESMECALAEAEVSASKTLAEEVNQLSSSHAEELHKLKSELESRSSEDMNRIQEEVARIEAELSEKYSTEVKRNRESLAAEKEEAHNKVLDHIRSEHIAATEKLKLELESSSAQEIAKLLAEVASTASNAKAAAENLTMKTEEANDLRKEAEKLQLSLEEATKANEPRSVQSIAHGETAKENDGKIKCLQSEIDQLRESNIQLTAQSTSLQTQNDGSTSVADLMKDLAEVNANFQRLQNDHQSELQQIRNELDYAKETNVALEEAVEDLQVEKEDLEAENEELAVKLTDLTTQAKTMLIRNDEMETQLSEVNMDWEERMGELENAMQTLQIQYGEALDLIEQYKNGNTNGTGSRSMIENGGGDETKFLELEEENAQLRQVIDHLSSENNAATEIKSIVLELREKNMEMTESLRASREQKKAALNAIQNLKAENEDLRNEIVKIQDSMIVHGYDQSDEDHSERSQSLKSRNDGIIPHQNDLSETPDMSKMEVELNRCKMMITELLSDRKLFNRKLSELMETTHPLFPKRRHSIHVDSNGNIKLDASAELQQLLQATQDEVDLIRSESHAASDALVLKDMTSVSNIIELEGDNSQALISHYNIPPASEVEEQIMTLTYENGQLAQRLGGAVAEKEFALSTLSALSAKMEELIDRNKYLESIANNIRSSHAQVVSRSAMSYTSKDPTGISMTSVPSTQYYSREDDTSHQNTMRDPSSFDLNYESSVYREEVNFPSSSTAHFDDPTAYGDIDSASPPKQLEPESHFVDSDCDGSVDLPRDYKKAPQEETTKVSTLRHFKVPGGEYIGQTNEYGQKHGHGTMKYDNGNEYEGAWENNKRDGKGTTKYASGNVYIGSWFSGKRHGFGVFHIKKTGDVYRGNWEHGLKSGPGVYEYADGELDVSFYSGDIRAGEGVRWSANRRLASRLVDGQLVGHVGGLPLSDAKKLTEQLGFVV